MGETVRTERSEEEVKVKRGAHGRRGEVLEAAWKRAMGARAHELARVAIPMMETFGPLDAERAGGGFLRVGEMVREELRGVGGEEMPEWVVDWAERWMGEEWVGLDEMAMYVRMVQLGGIRVLMGRG